MRLSSLIVLISLSIQALACVGCLRREDNGPMLKKLGEQHVGEYQLNPEEHGRELHWTKPRLILAEDHSFHFVSFPPEWLPALARPEDKVLDGSGKWRVASDPEFGVFEYLDVESVNGRPVELTLRLWLGSLILETQNGKKIARFARAARG